MQNQIVQNFKIMEHNIVHYLYSVTSDWATVKSATSTINSPTSKSATANSEALK